MKSQWRIDIGGVFQLAALALLAGGVWAFLFLSFPHAHIGAAPGVIAGIVVAGLAVGAQLWGWSKAGGRAAVVAVSGWIRAGAVPADVPRESWFPALAKREQLARRQWPLVFVAAIQLVLAVTRLTDSNTGDRLFWSFSLAFWVGAAAWVAYYNLRWLPVIRRLLREE